MQNAEVRIQNADLVYQKRSRCQTPYLRICLAWRKRRRVPPELFFFSIITATRFIAEHPLSLLLISTSIHRGGDGDEAEREAVHPGVSNELTALKRGANEKKMNRMHRVETRCSDEEWKRMLFRRRVATSVLRGNTVSACRPAQGRAPIPPLPPYVRRGRTLNTYCARRLEDITQARGPRHTRVPAPAPRPPGW